MSAFYDLASLVLVPSGYKASKVYAQKPLTTDGQLTFSRASTATRVNSAGLIETVSSNVPRLDYTDSTCPKLLLEPSRTNVVLQSQALNTTWTDFGTGTTVTPNATTAPDGTLTADLVSFSALTSPSQQVLAQVLTLTTGVPYTISFYAKTVTGTVSNLVVRINGAEVPLGQTITTTWQRFTKVITPVTAIDDSGFKNRPAVSGSGAAIDVYIWGVQIEQGAYATSYVKTEAATVTRLADACSKTGISSLIGQTEGTVFGEFTFTGRVPEMHMFLSVAGSYGNAIYVENSSSNRISMQVWSGVTQQCFIITSSYTVGQNIKFAAAYKNNDFVFYVNGTQIGTDTSGSVPSGLSQVEVGGYAEAGSPFNYSSPIKQAMLFKTRLTNAQLAELTAL